MRCLLRYLKPTYAPYLASSNPPSIFSRRSVSHGSSPLSTSKTQQEQYSVIARGTAWTQEVLDLSPLLEFLQNEQNQWHFSQGTLVDRDRPTFMYRNADIVPCVSCQTWTRQRVVRSKMGSKSWSFLCQICERHSTLLCWTNRSMWRWGLTTNDFTMEWISFGVVFASPLASNRLQGKQIKHTPPLSSPPAAMCMPCTWIIKPSSEQS